MSVFFQPRNQATISSQIFHKIFPFLLQYQVPFHRWSFVMFPTIGYHTAMRISCGWLFHRKSLARRSPPSVSGCCPASPNIHKFLSVNKDCSFHGQSNSWHHRTYSAILLTTTSPSLYHDGCLGSRNYHRRFQLAPGKHHAPNRTSWSPSFTRMVLGRQSVDAGTDKWFRRQ